MVEGRLFVVGTGGTIAVRESQDGSWVGQPTNMTKDRDLYAVAASSQDKVYAFGAAGTVLKWLGTSWQTIAVGAPLHAADDFVGASWVMVIGWPPAQAVSPAKMEAYWL